MEELLMIKEHILKVLKEDLEMEISDKPFSKEREKFVEGFQLDENRVIKCSWCDFPNIDWCWNCEIPICENHLFVINFPDQRLAFGVCEDCRLHFVKYQQEKK